MQEEVTEAEVATRRRSNHIGSSLEEDWLEEESAKDPSFAAGLEEQFNKYRLAQQLKAAREGVSRRNSSPSACTRNSQVSPDWRAAREPGRGWISSSVSPARSVWR